MKTILLFKEIFLENLREPGHYLARHFLRALAWFSFALFFIVLYAFVFRIAAGFAFD